VESHSTDREAYVAGVSKTERRAQEFDLCAARRREAAAGGGTLREASSRAARSWRLDARREQLFNQY